MATFQPSSGYGEAFWYEDPIAIPSVGGYWPNSYPRQSGPLDAMREIEEARQADADRKAAEVASHIPGAPHVPVGNKDLVLLTGPGDGKLKRRSLTSPFWERSWFWPVVTFSVALGVVSSFSQPAP
tara:strand:- start:211 stop:588 length:378 start_codon:yes stop_codon:yes gene_type:complete